MITIRKNNMHFILPHLSFHFTAFYTSSFTLTRSDNVCQRCGEKILSLEFAMSLKYRETYGSLHYN